MLGLSGFGAITCVPLFQRQPHQKQSPPSEVFLGLPLPLHWVYALDIAIRLPIQTSHKAGEIFLLLSSLLESIRELGLSHGFWGS